MSLQQRWANVRLGLRTHQANKLQNVASMVTRRLRHGIDLEARLPPNWVLNPNQVHIIPTYRCNLKCPMCFQRDEVGAVRVDMADRELTPAQWRLVIDQAVELASDLLWMGGEIFVYAGMVDLLAYAKAKGVKVQIITNGFFLEEVAPQLVAMELDAITVSLDGLEAAHTMTRRHPRSFRRAVAGIKAVTAAAQAQQKKRPCLIINYALAAPNYQQVPDFVAFARTLGVDRVQFVGLSYLNQQTAQAHHAVLHQEFGVTRAQMAALDNGHHAHAIEMDVLKQHLQTLRSTPAAAPAIRFIPQGLPYHLDDHYGPDERLPLPQQRCAWLWRRLVIQPNGDVSACYNQPELVMGNVLADSLAHIWRNEAFQQARQRIYQELLPGCIRCTWLNYR